MLGQHDRKLDCICMHSAVWQARKQMRAKALSPIASAREPPVSSSATRHTTAKQPHMALPARTSARLRQR